jgi:hypothetical protein
VDKIGRLVSEVPSLTAAIDLIAISCRGGAGGRDCRGRLVFFIQCPALETTPEVTSVATKHGSSAMAVPNDLSAPIASTGIVNVPLAAKALLSIASCVNAPN